MKFGDGNASPDDRGSGCVHHAGDDHPPCVEIDQINLTPSMMFSPSESMPSTRGVADRLICTLPHALIQLLQQHFDDGSVDPEIWTQEFKWTELSAGPQSVALWRNSVVHYPHFEWLELGLAEIPPDLGHEEKSSHAQANLVATRSIERYEKSWRVAKGYLGWLLTNTEFLAEHDQLVKDHHDEIAASGFPFLTRHRSGSPSSVIGESNSWREERLDVWDRFYLRWRLMGFAAPYLPLPLEPQLPVLAKVRTAALADQVGGLLYSPDIYPIPSGEELRNILEDALRQISGTEHLADWMKLISPHNMSKTGIDKFARHFEVQHYARIVQQRFPAVLGRRRKGFDEALSHYWEVPEATIRGDIAEINNRLDKDWMSRRCGFEVAR